MAKKLKALFVALIVSSCIFIVLFQMCAITVDPQSCPTGMKAKKYLDRLSSSVRLPLITGRSPLWVNGDDIANLTWAIYKVVLPNTNQSRNLKVPSERAVNYTVSTKSSGTTTDMITAATISELAKETHPVNQVVNEPLTPSSEVTPSNEQALSPPNPHLVQFPVPLFKSGFNIHSKQQSPNSLYSPNTIDTHSSRASLLTKKATTNVGLLSTYSTLTKKHSKAASEIVSPPTYTSHSKRLRRFTAGPTNSSLNSGRLSLAVHNAKLQSHHTIPSQQLQVPTISMGYAQIRKTEKPTLATSAPTQHPTQGTTMRKQRPRKPKVRPDFSSLPTTPLSTLNLSATPDHPLPKMDTYVCKDRLCTEFLTPLDMFYFNSCTDRQQHAKVKIYRGMPLGKCHFMNGTNRAPVALVSFPGSGNTWVRGLLEQATGVCTGRSVCLGRGKLGTCLA